MFVLLLRRYVLTCGLLLVPILAWNVALARRLPPAIADPGIWGAIPRPLAWAENAVRIVVFAMPFFMPLQVASRRQRWGLALLVVGTGVYFASWIALIAWPQSAWANSAAGFLAPAYTPVPWLAGVALLGQEFSWGGRYRPWMYAVPSALFLAVHLAHATLVHAHSYGPALSPA